MTKRLDPNLIIHGVVTDADSGYPGDNDIRRIGINGLDGRFYSVAIDDEIAPAGSLGVYEDRTDGRPPFYPHSVSPQDIPDGYTQGWIRSDLLGPVTA